MSTSRQPRGALLLNNLPALQNLIKRDPASYLDEFLLQFNAYNSLQSTLDTSLTKDQVKLRELIGFIAQVAECYPEHTKGFPQHLADMLLSNQTLQPETKRTCIHSLVLLRHREQLSSLELMKTLFPLLGMTASPNLRGYIFKCILSDIKQANKKSKNHKLNRTIQSFLFDMVERTSDSQLQGSGLKKSLKKSTSSSASSEDREAMLAVKLCSDLFKRNIWTDSKTVQILSLACFHSNTKVASAAIHFFLSSGLTDDEEGADSDDNEQDATLPDIKKMYHQSTINKTRRSTLKKEKQTIKNSHKKRKRQLDKQASSANFSALQLLLDPQEFSERLYADLLLKNDKSFTLEHKVLIMTLFGRVVGMHQTIVLGFYPYVIRYIQHSQPCITSILVAIASSIHPLIPPDSISPIVRKLADQFVHPGVNAQVIAAGLNAIREICRRQPLAMEADLLSDLTEYKKSRDKGVMYAARGLLQLFREVDPSLLKRRERGKVAATTGKDKAMPGFGRVTDSIQGIEGLELLQAYKEENKANGLEEQELDDDAQWQDWAAASDDESEEESENGWINVDSDEEEADIQLSDSDSDSNDDRRRKKVKGAHSPDGEEQQITFELENDSDESASFSSSDDDSDEKDDESQEETSPAEKLALEEIKSITNLAATQILTPADFAKLNELRTNLAEEAAKTGSGAAKRQLKQLKAQKAAINESQNRDAVLTESEIIGYVKRSKDDYTARLESVAKGREGREKFGSRKGQRKDEKHSSKTNFEKRKTKNIMMHLHSKSVKSKKHASLRDKQKKLRGHINKQKKAKK